MSTTALKTHCYCCRKSTAIYKMIFHSLRALFLCSLTTNSSSQLDVFWHDCDSFCMNRTQVGVFKQTNQVCLTCFLKSTNSCTLEAKICLEILSYLSHQPLKRKFTNEQFSGFLVTTNFTQCNCSWPITMWLLHSTSGWSTFPSSLCSKLLARSFATSRFSSCLFGTCHHLQL